MKSVVQFQGLVDPKWQAPVPLFSWGGLLSPAFWIVLVVGMSISLLVPDELAQRNHYLITFTDVVRQTLLGINRFADINAHAKTTAFPHTALLSHAFLWTGMTALLIFNTLASLIHWRYYMEWFYVVRPTLMKSEVKISQYLGAMIFCIGGAIVFSMLPGSTSFFGKTDLSSRLFFAFLSGIFIFQMQIVAPRIPYFYFLLSRYFRK
jgi:hypothetical protein